MKGTNKIYDAYALADQGFFGDAKVILEDTLTDNPGLIEGWLLLADLADTSEEALECYQMILEIDGNNWVSKQRINLLLDQSKDFFSELERKPMINEQSSIERGWPTVKESFETHKPLLLGIAAGILMLFMAGALIFFWVVGFLLWETNYLAYL